MSFDLLKWADVKEKSICILRSWFYYSFICVSTMPNWIDVLFANPRAYFLFHCWGLAKKIIGVLLQIVRKQNLDSKRFQTFSNVGLFLLYKKLEFRLVYN